MSQRPVGGKMAGIHEVAKEAGVSASTVSNVINGRDDKMRAETRQRVLVAIERLKFTPNSAARQLKSGHNTTLGLGHPVGSQPLLGLRRPSRRARSARHRLQAPDLQR